MLRKPLQRAILIGLPSPPVVGRDSSWKSLFRACFHTSADTLRNRATIQWETDQNSAGSAGQKQPRFDMGGKRVHEHIVAGDQDIPLL